MRSKTGIWILVGTFSALVIAFIIWIFSANSVNWTTNYSYQSKHPYGTKFIHQLVKKKYDRKNFKIINQSFEHKIKKLDPNKKYDYIRLGSYKTYDQAALSALLEFAENGNNVFISNAKTQEYLLDSLFGYIDQSKFKDEDSTAIDSIFNELNLDTVSYEEFYEEDEEEYDDWEDLNNEEDLTVEEDTFVLDEDFEGVFESLFGFGSWHHLERPYYNEFQSESSDVKFIENNSKTYQFYEFYKLDTFDFNWRYLNHTFLNNLDSLEFNVISKEYSNNVVMLDIPYGKGHIYIHQNPIAFTNVELLIEDRLEYAEQVFSNLDGDVMLWDVFRRKANLLDKEPPSEEGSDSPLSYFLANKALRWSIYLTLIGAMLFVIFKAKRKQQFIPVVEPNSNTSLEYVEMMGQLYFKEQNHQFIAAQLWRKWVDFLRDHYFIVVKENDLTWMKKVAEKSMFPESRLNGILTAYQKTKLNRISEEDLMNFYNKLQYFYSNCK